MQTDLPVDAIDSRLALQVYAVAAAVYGAILFLWGPIWIDDGGALNGQPYGLFALVRVAGALAFASGVIAFGLSRVADPADRHDALGWLAAAHFIVLFAALFQYEAIWGGGLTLRVWLWPTVATVGLFYAWQRANGERSPWQRVRSHYEEHIRTAAAQEERHRLARELHDSIKQQLFVIQTAAATAETRFAVDASGARSALDDIREAGREAMVEMNVMLDQLRAAPLENIGLAAALRQQGEALGFRTGAIVDVMIGRLPPEATLPPGAQQAILRVAQEALSNIARHARARHATVALDSTDTGLELRVVDDGSGFDLARAGTSGMGIGNIRSRMTEFGGTCELTSTPGQGTSIVCALPLSAPRRRNYPAGILLNFVSAVLSAFVIAINDSRVAFAFIAVFVLSVLEIVRHALAWWRVSHERGDVA